MIPTEAQGRWQWRVPRNFHRIHETVCQEVDCTSRVPQAAQRHTSSLCGAFTRSASSLLATCCPADPLLQQHRPHFFVSPAMASPSHTAGSVAMDSDTKRGPVLRAARDFAPGDLVLCETPLVCTAQQDPALKSVDARLMPHVLALQQICKSSEAVRQEVEGMTCPDLGHTHDIIAEAGEAARIVFAGSGMFGAYGWARGVSESSLHRCAVAFHVHALQYQVRCACALGGPLNGA